ncbi:MAG: phosphoribosylformylglycinamidine synthase subunit PurL [Patescibacteria group bacterium]
MAHRITVESVADRARAAHIRGMLSERFPKARVREVSVTNAYTIDKTLSVAEQKKVTAALTNPVIERSSFVSVIAPKKFSVALEIGFLPGVTDNVGNTVRQMIEDATGKKFKVSEAVYSSVFIFLSGSVSEEEVKRMALELHNPLIEEAKIIPSWTWKRGHAPLRVPKVTLTASSKADTVDLHVPDEELTRIGKEGILGNDGVRRGPLALSIPELLAIRAYFDSLGRNPTDVELEAIAQTWSEHCKHTIFNDPLDEISEGIYRRYIKGATERIRKAKGKKDFCVSVFKDNSGGIEFDEKYVVTHKMETHNSPSALDPYGGAMTGIVGVNRDTLGFGLGAKPIANLYGFCVGRPNEMRTLYRDKEKTVQLLPPRRILEGVVRGINAGGNQSGIPTPLGFVYADDSYRGKPLVFAGTVGLVPKKKGSRVLSSKQAKAGDYIVMIGGRVGLDGIHGATFSSEDLKSGSPATAVQIGDPITQKRFSDALIREVRDAGLYNSITDNGAGGLSSSVGEMAEQSGGCVVDLAKVPLKYPGLSPWQIWISESQERMTLSVPKKSWKKMKTLFDKHGVEATVIGEFTKSGSCVVTYGAKKVMNVGLEFLHDGRPKRQQESRELEKIEHASVPAKDVQTMLPTLLASPNIGSYAFISRQYDHEVQGTSVTKPLQGPGGVNADAAVLKPVSESNKGIVLSHGYAPAYSGHDAYAMAAASIDTAVRNAIASGASLSHLAILDNFCWSSSLDPKRLYQLRRAAEACYDTAVAYGTPYISGKDSMFNDFRGYDDKGNAVHIAAMPTLLVSAIGVIKDVQKTVTMDVNHAGDVVYLLGETKEEFGGSEYARMLNLPEAGVVPQVNVKENLKTYRALEKTIQGRLVSAALGLSRGGLAVTAAKMCISGGRGMSLSVPKIAPHAALYSESQGRILVTVPKAKTKKFEEVTKGLVRSKLGTVIEEKNLAMTVGTSSFSWSLSELSRAYRKPFNTFDV